MYTDSACRERAYWERMAEEEVSKKDALTEELKSASAELVQVQKQYVVFIVCQLNFEPA